MQRGTERKRQATKHDKEQRKIHEGGGNKMLEEATPIHSVPKETERKTRGRKQRREKKTVNRE